MFLLKPKAGINERKDVQRQKNRFCHRQQAANHQKTGPECQISHTLAKGDKNQSKAEQKQGKGFREGMQGQQEQSQVAAED